jgi:hypothetical protein
VAPDRGWRDGDAETSGQVRRVAMSCPLMRRVGRSPSGSSDGPLSMSVFAAAPLTNQPLANVQLVSPRRPRVPVSSRESERRARRAPAAQDRRNARMIGRRRLLRARECDRRPRALSGPIRTIESSPKRWWAPMASQRRKRSLAGCTLSVQRGSFDTGRARLLLPQGRLRSSIGSSPLPSRCTWPGTEAL